MPTRRVTRETTDAGVRANVAAAVNVGRNTSRSAVSVRQRIVQRDGTTVVDESVTELVQDDEGKQS